MKWGAQALIWPNRQASRFVDCRPHRWHVQEMGPEGPAEAPLVLLLHGAGGATHSWREVMPRLAGQVRVVGLDLPGQGFTAMGTRSRSGLVHTAEDIAALCRAEGWRPDALVGHSAGAALALQLSRVLEPAPRAIVGINAALEPFPGPAQWAFPLMARMLSANPLTAALFASGIASQGSVAALIRSTGSTIDAEGLALYRAVISDRAHVDGALNMMAQWDLAPLAAALPEIEADVLLLAGERDRAVPPAASARAAKALPHARVEQLPGLGHLAHEEAPQAVAALILAHMARGGAAPDT